MRRFHPFATVGRRASLLPSTGALALSLLLVGAATGCGKKGDTTTPEGQAAAGGEAQPGQPGAAPGTPAAAGATAAAANKPSPWGSTEAETGRPLPARKPLAGNAKQSYDDGVKAAQAGNNAAARSAFEAAVKEDSGAFQALYALGVLSDREGKESQAIDYYRRALRAQADDAASARGIVVIYLRQGQPDKALSFIRPLAEQWERSTCSAGRARRHAGAAGQGR